MGIAQRVIAGVAGGGLALGAGLYYMDETKRNDQGEIVEAGALGVFNFQIGDCLTDMPDLTKPVEVQEGVGVPCSEPHQYEVFFETDLVADSFVEDDIIKESEAACIYESFTEYVGADYNSTPYDVVYLYPTEGSWAEGDRMVTCLLIDYNGELLTGSAKDSQ